MPLHFHEKALDGLSTSDADRVIKKAEWLWDNRQAVTHHPLKENLTGLYKRRIGKLRIVYSYSDNPDEMVIRLAGLRDDIYQRATQG